MNMKVEDLQDTMNRILDKAQDSVENLVEQYETSYNENIMIPESIAEVDINKRDIDHAFDACRSSIEMSME